MSVWSNFFRSTFRRSRQRQRQHLLYPVLIFLLFQEKISHLDKEDARLAHERWELAMELEEMEEQAKRDDTSVMLYVHLSMLLYLYQGCPECCCCTVWRFFRVHFIRVGLRGRWIEVHVLRLLFKHPTPPLCIWVYYELLIGRYKSYSGRKSFIDYY